jgi:hypothetical protein
MLCTTGMILSTCTGTGRIPSTIRNALVAPFLTDVEGEGLGVLGQVGREAIGTDTGVG